MTPRALAAALRGDLAAIVHRCLQSEPARRYATVQALTNDLQAWLDVLGNAAGLPPPGVRLLGPSDRPGGETL